MTRAVRTHAWTHPWRRSAAITPRVCAIAVIATISVLATACSTASVASTSGAAGGSGVGGSGLIPEQQRQAAPNISGVLLDGSDFTLGDWRGEVVVINFWGSWCAPCRAEAPELAATYEATKADGVQFLGVDLKDQRQLAVAFEARYGIDYPSIFDPRNEVAVQFRNFPVNAIPTTLILDRQGRTAALFPRPIRRGDLLPVIASLTQEPG